jgi:aconitate hydratase
MANLVNFGILPLIFNDPQDYEKMQPGDELCIENTSQALNHPIMQIKNLSRGYMFEVSFSLTPRQVAIIRGGGLLSLYGSDSPIAM